MNNTESTVSKVRQFHKAFELQAPEEVSVDVPTPNEQMALITLRELLLGTAEAAYVMAEATKSKDVLRVALITEELKEVVDELASGDQVKLLKELSDLQYVLDGAYVERGLGHLKSPAFNRVHKSNMSKLDSEGLPIRDAAGKVRKSTRS
jgi:predicted HAD superfamily Cof-like phosphohydrolase